MRRSESAMARELDGEVVILDIPSGRYFAINDVGALIWDRLEHDTDRTSLVDAVTAEFHVDTGTAAADIDALLTDLIDAGLVIEGS